MASSERGRNDALNGDLMARRIIVLTPDGKMPLLTEVMTHDEAQLQSHLNEHPTMIPIEEFGWSGPLMVVGRECSLPSGAPDLVAIAPSGQIGTSEMSGVRPGVGVRVRGTGALQI